MHNGYKNIHLLTIPPDFEVIFPNQFIHYQATVDAKHSLNRKIRMIAKKHNIQLVDSYEILKDSLGKTYSEDGIHLNDKAYSILNQSLKK